MYILPAGYEKRARYRTFILQRVHSSQSANVPGRPSETDGLCAAADCNPSKVKAQRSGFDFYCAVGCTSWKWMFQIQEAFMVTPS